MTDLPKAGKYRAVLDERGGQVFAFVFLQDNGSITWEIVDEHQFNAATVDDLPPDQYDRVSETFRMLCALEEFPEDEVPR